MQTFRATAVHVGVLHELGVDAVIFAEHHDGTGLRLEIQKALSFDARDRAMGMDTYALCTERGCHYGGVLRWRLHEDVLAIWLDAEAARSLGVVEGFHVEVSAGAIAGMREALERLLGVSN